MPELDECFHVRSVKKGAEPVNGLRDKLREIIYKTVEPTLRKQVRATFDATEAAAWRKSAAHADAEEFVARAGPLTDALGRAVSAGSRSRQGNPRGG